MNATLSQSGLQALVNWQGQQCGIAVGGIPATCLTGIRPGATGGPEFWFALGIGLRDNDTGVRRIAANDWPVILQGAPESLRHLDGHFIAGILSDQQARFFNDRLGLRTVYFRTSNQTTYFATRLDVLNRLAGRERIRLAALGAQWFSLNRYTSAPLLENTTALPPGGTGSATKAGLTIRDEPWSPRLRQTGDEDVAAHLDRYLDPGPFHPSGISLGLSGGLDSRVLLGLLLKRASPFEAHVFGDCAEADVIISKQLARAVGFPHHHREENVEATYDLPQVLLNYTAQTEANYPASQHLRTDAFAELHAMGWGVIDGGFGEIARRQFMNRVLIRDRDAVLSRDAARIWPHLQMHRASIFSEEVRSAMKEGALSQLNDVLQRLPDPKSVGPETFVDLFSIRTRLPYYYGIEQARMDTIVQNLMPYAQPGVIETVLGLPLARRANGRCLRSLVRDAHPALAQCPLVKGSTTYPFALGTKAAWLWTHLKNRVRPPTTSPLRRRFLLSSEIVVRQFVGSQSFTQCELYNLARVRHLVEAFYTSGGSAGATELDWWLSFESWRRGVEGRD